MKDEKYMQYALELARKGVGLVNPNPCVGAVIVKEGKIIGEGWHKKYGEAVLISHKFKSEYYRR